jgi:molybdopterin-guanine dinucleotide biosynthesis adapter protein
MVPTVAIIGVSDSGKTSTAEHLISNLTKEGYVVGSVKYIHHEDFSIDKKNTDTWRHTEAGSKVTVAIAPKQTVILKKTNAALNSLNQIIRSLENEKLDFVLIEGFHPLIGQQENIPKIVTAKNLDNLQEALAITSPPILAITGLIAENKLDLLNTNLPVIRLSEETSQLVELIKSFFAKNPAQ